MSEELKACPFCGSEAEMVTNRSGDNFVRCANRQCAAKTRLYHENEAGARIAWNKREEPGCDRDALLALADEMNRSRSRCDFCIKHGECDWADETICLEKMMDDYASVIREALGEPAS